MVLRLSTSALVNSWQRLMQAAHTHHRRLTPQGGRGVSAAALAVAQLKHEEGLRRWEVLLACKPTCCTV